MFDPSIISFCSSFSLRRSNSFIPSINTNASNTMNSSAEQIFTNVVFSSFQSKQFEMFAERQRKQIEKNEILLISREKYLKKLEENQKQIQNEKLQKLVDEQKHFSFDDPLELLQKLFQREEQKLILTLKKIDDLTKHLNQLRKTSIKSNQIEKLTQELRIRNELNDEQCRKLVFQRDLIKLKENELNLLNDQIDELRGKKHFQSVDVFTEIENQMIQLAQSFDAIEKDFSTSKIRLNDDFYSIQFNSMKSNVKKRHSIEINGESDTETESLISDDDEQKSIDSISTTIEMKSFQLKSLLKSSNSPKNSTRHVVFDPFVLLLDAAAVGDLQLLIESANEVQNLSQPNDEGLTALHNAVCAGNFDCVKFLIEAGCDVNSADNDGWTPLHCGASCNNKDLAEFLIEHGASIFARTFRDRETPAEKCEDEDSPMCFEYLREIENRLGVTNEGLVYALFDYDPEGKSVDDELKFVQGEKLRILRRNDENENEWWWAKREINDDEGFVPRNFLGIFPRFSRSSN